MTIPISSDTELRLLELSDASEIYQTIMKERAYLGKWLPFVHDTHSFSDSLAFVESKINAPADRFEYVFTIRHNGKLVGLIGFVDTDRYNLKTEIGYWLAQSYQKKGIMTQAVAKLCEFAFTHQGINRIQIKCAMGNTSSSHIPQRLGFTFEGIERDGEQFHDGIYVDLEVYSLLKREANHILTS